MLNTLKQQVYARFSACLAYFLCAILFALVGWIVASAVWTACGMAFLIWFLDVWLEPEKWKQKQ